MSKVSFMIGFLVGSAVTGILTGLYLDKRFTKQREFDLAEYKAMRKTSSDESVKTDKLDTDNTTKNTETVRAATDAYLKYGGTKESIESYKKDRPKSISPEEVGLNSNYPVINLMYFEDNVLTNMDGDEIDVDNVIGEENLKHFGEFDANMLYIENVHLRAYYEVEKQNTSYYDEEDDNH